MLRDLLYKTAIRSVNGSTDIAISGLHTDSREVTAGSCFIAVKGSATDGHQFIDAAIGKGAVAVVCEQLPAAMAEGVVLAPGNVFSAAQTASRFMRFNVAQMADEKSWQVLERQCGKS